MKIQHRANQKSSYPGRLQIISALKHLGVSQKSLYPKWSRSQPKGGFWLRSVNHLDILEQARNNFRKQIKEVHPDKKGGCSRKTLELNRSWGFVQKKFRAAGHTLN